MASLSIPSEPHSLTKHRIATQSLNQLRCGVAREHMIDLTPVLDSDATVVEASTTCPLYWRQAQTPKMRRDIASSYTDLDRRHPMRSTVLLATAIILMSSSTSFSFEGDRTSMFVCCQHANSFHDYTAYHRLHMQSYFSGSRSDSFGARHNFTRYGSEPYRAHNPYQRY